MYDRVIGEVGSMLLIEQVTSVIGDLQPELGQRVILTAY
jgi:hypothetical protein